MSFDPCAKHLSLATYLQFDLDYSPCKDCGFMVRSVNREDDILTVHLRGQLGDFSVIMSGPSPKRPIGGLLPHPRRYRVARSDDSV